MVDLRLALDFGWLVWVVGAHLEVEPEAASLVEALVRTDEQFEVEEVIRIGEFGGAGLGQVELVQVWKVNWVK